MTAVASARARLETYLRAEDWTGWDPFDGLNSRLFQATPLRHHRFSRLALLQLCKRSPLNLRPLLDVPKDINNKGFGLFLASAARLYRLTADEYYRQEASRFAEYLKSHVSPGYSGACWGYNFDWQARAFFQPKGTPTVVATNFVANALLDAHDSFGWKELFPLVRSACDFVLKDLNRTVNGESFCFSYSPEDHTQVFNASLLGTQLLARVGARTGEEALLDAARRSARYVVEHQAVDGSWAYGTLPFHTWVDNFHTGFNLDCLDDYSRYTGDTTHREAITKGFTYYRDHLFLSDGTPKYYHDKTYPIDAHSAAQAILTLVRFGDVAFADTVARWAIQHMQAEDGSFFYQITKRYTNKTRYMRWVQAWMFRGLVELEMAQQAEQAVPFSSGESHE